jgi:hypothetical protein
VPISHYFWLLFSSSRPVITQLLDEYFGRDAELTEADAFLKKYLANKAWQEPTDRLGGAGGSRKRLRGMGDDDGSDSGSEDEGDDGQGGLAVDEEEDAQFLEEVDRFEAAYNFRWASLQLNSNSQLTL